MRWVYRLIKHSDGHIQIIYCMLLMLSKSIASNLMLSVVIFIVLFFMLCLAFQSQPMMMPCITIQLLFLFLQWTCRVRLKLTLESGNAFIFMENRESSEKFCHLFSKSKSDVLLFEQLENLLLVDACSSSYPIMACNLCVCDFWEILIMSMLLLVGARTIDLNS